MQLVEGNSITKSIPLHAPLTERWWKRFTIALALGLLATNAVFRFLWLDRLPGINGDEAWYAVQIQDLLAGDAWSARTPTGLPINPLLVVTESALLVLCDASFWVLRLPVAVWCCVGLALTYWLHFRVFHDAGEALLVTTLTACLPAHLGYSRLCWDSSFSFVSVPTLLYGVLTSDATGRAAWRRFAYLVVPGLALTVWNHATHGVFALASLVVLACEFGRPLWPHLKRRPITSLLVFAGAMYVAMRLLRMTSEGREIWRSIRGSTGRLPEHFSALGDIVMGVRAYEYLAGVPRPAWAFGAGLVLVFTFAAVACLIARRGMASDWRLLGLAALTLIGVLLVGRRVQFNLRSYERYVLYVVPLAAVVFVRGLHASVFRWPRAGTRVAAATTLILSAGLLAQFWFNYFEPLRRQTYADPEPDRLHRTFWTSMSGEPKAELAAAIRARAGANATIYVEDWWLRWPVGYLLGPDSRVIDRFRVEEIIGPCFVTGFDGAEVLARVRADERLRGAIIETHRFGGPPREPRLVLLVLGPTDPRNESNPRGRHERESPRSAVDYGPVGRDTFH